MPFSTITCTYVGENGTFLLILSSVEDKNKVIWDGKTECNNQLISIEPDNTESEREIYMILYFWIFCSDHPRLCLIGRVWLEMSQALPWRKKFFWICLWARVTYLLKAFKVSGVSSLAELITNWAYVVCSASNILAQLKSRAIISVWLSLLFASAVVQRFRPLWKWLLASCFIWVQNLLQSTR